MQCIIINKIKMLFTKLVEPNYVLDSFYADGILNKLSNCTDPEISFLVCSPLMSDLIVEVWDLTQNAHSSVKVFLIRVLAIGAKHELHFGKIRGQLEDNIIQSFKNMNSSNMNSSYKVAYMEVALSLTEHNTGMAWLLEKGVWKEILSLCNEKQSVYVVRQTYKFFCKFLWALIDWNEEGIPTLKNVLDQILKPIFDTDFDSIECISSEEQDEISKRLEPMLQMLISVLSQYKRLEKPNVISKILLEDYNLVKHLLLVFSRIRKDDITFLVSKLTFLLNIAKIFLAKPVKPDLIYEVSDFVDLGVSYFNNVKYLLQRGSLTVLLDYCTTCNVIFTAVWQDKRCASMEQGGRTIELQNQLLFMCLVPSLVYVKKLSQGAIDERLQDYVSKLVNLTCPYTVSACTAFRDFVNELDPVAVTIQSLKRLTNLKEHLNSQQANLLFQAMFYILNDFEPLNERGEIKQEVHYGEDPDRLQIVTYVLEIVQSLVKDYDITWYESLEIICLYNVVFNILKRPNLSCKFVVMALNVISLTVKKFLPPNLSLLLESKPGTATHELGHLIYIKMNDMNWEIRDSALELLLVCTEISYIKFPPLQKQILENKLINYAATMMMNDSECYVQVTALKCLAAASKINEVWDQLQREFPHIQEILISILRNNSEGMVRKEACSALCDIYQHLRLTPAFKQTLYEHMVSSALGDFHWEVQLSALRYWRAVIHSLLRDQGMLDGTFPPVTFSRETRKIVNLNESEIKKRLLKILDELASIGCLTVLVKLLDEDTEVEIIELSLSISTEVLEILTRYKVLEHLKENDSDPKTVQELVCHISDEEFESDIKDEDVKPLDNSDSVIDGIVNSDDVNLLVGIYERQMNLENDVKPQIKPRITLLRRATPYLFVSYLKKKDFKSVIELKKRWKDGIRSFQSLLDDVLGLYEVNYEANALDCY